MVKRRGNSSGLAGIELGLSPNQSGIGRGSEEHTSFIDNATTDTSTLDSSSEDEGSSAGEQYYLDYRSVAGEEAAAASPQPDAGGASKSAAPPADGANSQQVPTANTPASTQVAPVSPSPGGGGGGFGAKYQALQDKYGKQRVLIGSAICVGLILLSLFLLIGIPILVCVCSGPTLKEGTVEMKTKLAGWDKAYLAKNTAPGLRPS